MAVNKPAIKEIMLHHLKLLGYPDNITVAQVINALPDIYRKLEEKNLLPKGMKFAIFKRIAEQKAMEAQLLAQASKFMRGFSGRF